jgi:hypothetical protein
MAPRFEMTDWTISRRTLLMAGLLPLADTACRALAPTISSSDDVLRPEDFGAVGDGLNNDTDAFARLSAAIEKNRGGVIELTAGTTYVVGQQRFANGRKTGRGFAFDPDPIIRVRNATGPVVVKGNGARLLAAPGLRYGTFDPRSGDARRDVAPFFENDKAATPYVGMIELTGCSGGIRIENIDLDGSVATMMIGGEFGDTGHQIPACGMYLIENAGSLVIENVRTHHHCLDGLLLRHRSANVPANATIGIRNLLATHNSRQGFSLAGGVRGSVDNSTFSHTGRGPLISAPAAGIDFEPDAGHIVRDWTFSNCTMVDNAGAGMLASLGDSAGISFSRCTFIGTTAPAAWPEQPKLHFEDCRFVGSVTNVRGGPLPNGGGARFVRCQFTDDPDQSPTHSAFVGTGPIVNLANNGGGAIFEGCEIRCLDRGQAIYSDDSGNIFHDCRLSQTSPVPMVPWVTFTGTNSINGAANTAYARIKNGSLTINGVHHAATSATEKRGSP